MGVDAPQARSMQHHRRQEQAVGHNDAEFSLYLREHALFGLSLQCYRHVYIQPHRFCAALNRRGAELFAAAGRARWLAVHRGNGETRHQ